MRTLTRKLLSLLLAFTMVCAMVPAAMAADENWGEWSKSECTSSSKEHTPGQITSRKDATCKDTGEETQQCGVCSATRTRTLPIDENAHDWGEWTTEESASCGKEGTEKRTCKLCSKEETRTIAALEHKWTNVDSGTVDGESVTSKPATCGEDGVQVQQCSECKEYQAVVLKATGNHTAPSDPSKYQNLGADGHSYTCDVCGQTVKVPTHNWSNGSCICGATYSTVPVDGSFIKDSVTLDYSDDSVELSYNLVDIQNKPTSDLTGVSVSSSDYDIVDVKLYQGNIYAYAVSSGTAKIYLRINGETVDTIEVTVDSDISVDVTVYNTGSYALGDEDVKGGDSVVDQIYDAIEKLSRHDELVYVKFDSVSSKGGELDASTKDEYYYDDDLEDVTFTADEDYKGNVSFGFRAYVDEKGKNYYSGTVTFKVEEGTASAGDIIYPAKSGDDVEFDVNDFEDFWEDKYSKGSLDYVTFGSVSSSRGDLVDADGDKVSSRTKYYADPTSKQADLDGVTFEPGRNTKTTVTIDFTAHGTNNSKRDAELNGTVVILYTEKDPEAIVYSSTGKNITLDADDFLDNYKDTMGSSASNIQIQFLEVPSNGTLYYKYNERTEKGTELTSKNVANHTFSTSSRASKSIEDVTYVPDSRGRSDTVRFACYTSGGDLRYYGEVTFGQTVQNVTVNMTSTSSGVTFQASTFFNADDALLSANTISFGTPSSGTLYKNWNGTSGTRVTASDMFSYVASVTGNASISTVTYVPVAGYSGTVTIPFSAYGAAGGIVSGTVSIRVTATTPTTIFTDVPTTGSQAWAYPYINRLAAAGVVSGVTPTTYGPKQTVKWGEALKMVLLGAGHPAQVEGTGSNWASGYLTYAVNNGIVSNTNINLSSNITRLEMAELAAKALGMSPASRINTGIVGPTDTTNGYVYALYNAGIVGGDSSSGQNRYNGGSTLLRDEMAKIVCGVMDNA